MSTRSTNGALPRRVGTRCTSMGVTSSGLMPRRSPRPPGPRTFLHTGRSSGRMRLMGTTARGGPDHPSSAQPRCQRDGGSAVDAAARDQRVGLVRPSGRHEITTMARGSGSSGRRVRDERRFVILGAGLTGLSVAARLEELGESNYLLIEKEDRPGGWAKTDWSGDYGAERGIHVLYFRDDGVRRQVEGLLAVDGYAREDCVVDSGGSERRSPSMPTSRSSTGTRRRVPGGPPEASADQRSPAPPATFLEWILTPTVPAWLATSWCRTTPRCGRSRLSQMTADWMGGFIPPVDIRRSLEGAALGRRQPGRPERGVLLSRRGGSRPR